MTIPFTTRSLLCAKHEHVTIFSKKKWTMKILRATSTGGFDIVLALFITASTNT